MALIKEYAKLAKAIAQFGKATHKQGLIAHGLLASAAMHAIEHGNATLCAQFMNDVAPVVDKVSAMKWLAKHGVNVRFDKKDGAFKATNNTEMLAKLKAEWQANPQEFEADIEADNFTKIGEKTQRDFDGFDLPKMLATLAGKASKVKDDPAKANHDKTDLRLLADLQRILDSFNKSSKPKPVVIDAVHVNSGNGVIATLQ